MFRRSVRKFTSQSSWWFNNSAGKISAHPHTILKQIRFPNGNPLFLSLFSLSKNWMHNVVWGCAEVLPYFLSGLLLNYDLVDEGLMLETSAFLLFETKLSTMILILLVSSL